MIDVDVQFNRCKDTKGGPAALNFNEFSKFITSISELYYKISDEPSNDKNADTNNQVY